MRKAVLVAVAVLAVNGLCAQEFANGDRQRLQGEWELVSVKLNGMEAPGFPNNMDTMKVKFMADKVVTFMGGKQMEEMSYKLDETKKPKRMEVGKGVNGAQESKCIYQLAGDTLTIAASSANMKEPPASFDAQEILIMTLRRAQRKP
jgi:uncharacterized protein (TIGR03067 family)